MKFLFIAFLGLVSAARLFAGLYFCPDSRIVFFDAEQSRFLEVKLNAEGKPIEAFFSATATKSGDTVSMSDVRHFPIDPDTGEVVKMEKLPALSRELRSSDHVSDSFLIHRIPGHTYGALISYNQESKVVFFLWAQKIFSDGQTVTFEKCITASHSPSDRMPMFATSDKFDFKPKK